MQPDNQVVSVLPTFLEEGKVADVEEVKGSRHIDYPVTLLWTLTEDIKWKKLEGTVQLENSRSFWVVGRNWESPVQGDLAPAPVLISDEAARSTWCCCTHSISKH